MLLEKYTKKKQKKKNKKKSWPALRVLYTLYPISWCVHVCNNCALIIIIFSQRHQNCA